MEKGRVKIESENKKAYKNKNGKAYIILIGKAYEK